MCEILFSALEVFAFRMMNRQNVIAQWRALAFCSPVGDFGLLLPYFNLHIAEKIFFCQLFPLPSRQCGLRTRCNWSFRTQNCLLKLSEKRFGQWDIKARPTAGRNKWFHKQHLGQIICYTLLLIIKFETVLEMRCLPIWWAEGIISQFGKCLLLGEREGRNCQRHVVALCTHDFQRSWTSSYFPCSWQEWLLPIICVHFHQTWSRNMLQLGTTEKGIATSLSPGEDEIRHPGPKPQASYQNTKLLEAKPRHNKF